MSEETAELLERYRAYLEEHASAGETRKMRMRVARTYLEWCEESGIDVLAATTDDARNYFAHLKKRYRAATVALYGEQLKQFYAVLCGEKLTKHNPFSYENLHGPRATRETLDADLEELINGYVGHRRQVAWPSSERASDQARVDAAVTDEQMGVREIRAYLKYTRELGLDWRTVTLADAENYQLSLVTKTDENGRVRYAAQTVRNAMRLIRSFHDYLTKRGLIMRNVFREVQRVREERKLPRDIPDEERLAKLLNRLKELVRDGRNLHERRRYYRLHVMAELMYATGARINEVLKLTGEDIDLARGTVKLKDDKTGKTRTGFVNSYAAELLRLYMTKREALRTRHSGDELFFGKAGVAKAYNRELGRVSNELGLGHFVSHNLRHAFGFHMLRAGCDIRHIQSFLGHERLVTTQVYTKVEKQDLRGVLDTFHPRASFDKAQDNVDSK